MSNILAFMHPQFVNVIFRPCGRTISATVGYFPSESAGLSIPRLRVIFEPPLRVADETARAIHFCTIPLFLYLFKP